MILQGGVTQSKKSQDVIRLFGLVVPIFLVFYGILIKNNLVNSSVHYSDWILFGLMACWMAVAIFQFVRKLTTPLGALWRLLAYHIFAGLYLIFVSGFSTPFVACWVLLSLASYAYFFDNGLKLSIAFFLLTATANILLGSYGLQIMAQDMTTLVAVLTITVAASMLMQVQRTDSRELAHSKNEEALQKDSILTIINNLSDSIISTDELGLVRVYNAASLNLLDTNSSLTGKHIDKIINLFTLEGEKVALFDKMRKNHGVTVIDDLSTKSGEETIRLEITLSPIRSSFKKSRSNDREDGYILIMRDITKSKSLEEERDEFISVVSHELRTPIAIAEGTISNTQLIFDRSGAKNDVLKDGLDEAHRQIIFLSSMVNDLSTLSRAERGLADQPESIDVKKLVNQLYSNYSPQAKAKGLHFNLDAKGELGKVVSSRLYLEELLQNFITNAIKYTKHGEVTVKVSKVDGFLTFCVQDTGIGISKSDISKIFKKFYRSEDYRTRETGGTGLGLYVAWKLAKKLGCEIKTESRINHGSSFSFKLPTEK